MATETLPDETRPLLQTRAAVEVTGQTATEDELFAEWQHVKWWKRPSVYWLLVPFTIFTIGSASTAVPKLNIIMELICREYYADDSLLNGIPLGTGTNDQCKTPEIQALVSRFALYIQLIAGVLNAFIAPIYGAYSDRNGRRLILAVSAFGLLMSELITLLTAKYSDFFSVNFLLVGAIFDGVTGGLMVALALSHSYAADCTTTKKRALGFGYFQGSLFFGVATGPALGGILIERTGDVLTTFYAALVAHGIFFLFVAFLLPESLSPSRMRQAQEKYARKKLIQREQLHDGQWDFIQAISSWNPLRPLAIFSPMGPGSSSNLRTNLIVLAACDTLFFGCGMGAMTVTIIYAEATFMWGNLESSIYLSFVNFTRVIMLFAVLPLVARIAGSRLEKRPVTTPSAVPSDQKGPQTGVGILDIFLIRFAIATELVGYLGYGLVATGTGFTLSGMLTALGGIGSPTAQSALTKHIPPDKTGQLLGASALLRSLARIIFPTLFGLVYADTVGTFPQAVFICLASVFLVSAVCSYFITPHVKMEGDKFGYNIYDDSMAPPSPSSPALQHTV